MIEELELLQFGECLQVDAIGRLGFRRTIRSGRRRLVMLCASLVVIRKAYLYTIHQDRGGHSFTLFSVCRIRTVRLYFLSAQLCCNHRFKGGDGCAEGGRERQQDRQARHAPLFEFHHLRPIKFQSERRGMPPRLERKFL